MFASRIRPISPLAGVVLVALVTGFGFDSTPYDAVAEGNALYRAGRYEAAAERYAAAAEILPDAAEIPFNLGNAYYRQFDLDKALEQYARALETGDRRLESTIKFNLGNVKYSQALGALQTFQDAATPLRAAIAHYRASLALDDRQPDVRYNLELADRLMREIRRQRVQAQENAEIRNQQTSLNQGQPFEQQSDEGRSRDRDAEMDADQSSLPRQAQQSSQNDASSVNTGQTQQGAPPQDMSPEAAERMVDIIRERARAAESRRQQARRARMRDLRVEKYW